MQKLIQNRSIDLDVRASPIQILEENIRENLCNPGLGKNFLGRTEKVGTIKGQFDKLYFVKISTFVLLQKL